MSQQPNPVAKLFRWDRKVSRKTYALTGLIGFAIKHNIDRFLARDYLPQANGLFNYWAPLGKAARLMALTYPEKRLLLNLALLSLPFVGVGVSMTLRRLRDAGQPLWLVCLFFVPFLNVAFFALLCFLPPKQMDGFELGAPWPHVHALDGVIPRGKLDNQLLSVLLTAAIGLLFLSLGTQVLGSYGWSLFIALPFCMGLFSVLLYSYHEPRSFESCLEVSIMPIVILAATLLAIAFEGIICLMMAAPIALFLALLGGSIGFVIQLHYWDTHYKPAVLTAILFLLPSAFFGEHAAALTSPDFVVHSAVTINASPEAVWHQVIAFAEIPPPQELLFRAGVAYPIRAEISGSGVGSTRLCIF